MYVAYGKSSNNYNLFDIEKLDLNSNYWSSLDTINVLPSISNPFYIRCNEKLLIWGGEGNDESDNY